VIGIGPGEDLADVEARQGGTRRALRGAGARRALATRRGQGANARFSRHE
jgi:hypothetical protein